MKHPTFAIAVGFLFLLAPGVLGAPTTLDLVGRWEGQIEFGKFKLKLVLRVAPSQGGQKVQVTLDVPEQGAKDVPVSALLYNHPDVRVEIDPFGTSFNGSLSGDGSAIIGEFEEGPGGRSTPVSFQRLAKPATAFPDEISFTPDAISTRDVRGDWKGSLDIQGRKLRLVFRVGRLPDSTLAGTFASLDQGGAPMLASRVTFTNQLLRVECKSIGGTYSGTLSAAGSECEGTWEQGGQRFPLRLSRTAGPADEPPSAAPPAAQ